MKTLSIYIGIIGMLLLAVLQDKEVEISGVF